MLKVVQVFRFGVDVKSSWSLCKYEQRVETTWNGTHLALLTHVRTPLPNLYRTSWHAINHESYKSTTPFTTLFDREIYHLCLHALPSSKSPSVDKIPNKIIKTLLPKHHGALYNLSTYLSTTIGSLFTGNTTNQFFSTKKKEPHSCLSLCHVFCGVKFMDFFALMREKCENSL